MAPFAKKATATTEAVLGQAASSLTKSFSELKNTVTSLETLLGRVDDLQLVVASKEDKITELDVVFKEKKRQLEVELEVKVKEDSLKVVREVLASQHLVSIPEQELLDLRKGLADCISGQETSVKAEVAKAAGAIAGNYDQKVKLLEAEYKAKEAGNLAEIVNLKSQVESLKHSVEEWKGQLDAERKASVERAKAGSVGTINVGAQETRR